MEKYERVKKPQQKSEDNEVRISKSTPVHNYAKYILSLFKEKGAQEVKMTSMGDAIQKVVSIAEIIKYRVKGLY